MHSPEPLPLSEIIKVMPQNRYIYLSQNSIASLLDEIENNKR